MVLLTNKVLALRRTQPRVIVVGQGEITSGHSGDHSSRGTNSPTRMTIRTKMPMRCCKEIESNDVESAIVLRCQFDAMLLSGGFRLRKWASNRPEVLKDIPKEDLALPTADGIDWDQDAEVKTLGLTWLPNADCFKFQFIIPPFVEGQHLTKRNVLSIVAKLFDPLGLLGATITTAKVFMQRLWTLENEKDRKLAWDDQLPQTVGEEWRKYHEQLPLLNTIQVPRCVITPGARSVEFHCFCDASMVAYGATVYVRSENQYGTVSVHLLTSKSKIAPLKTQSLPRLELCGALLSAQLWEKVSNAVKLDANVYFWTDSTCVLQWIKSAPGTWTTFVANRVAKIQAITEGCNWAHVSGKTNPADLISRGILPNEILENELWWSGPNWLKTPKHQWKASPIPDQTPLEMRKTFATCTAKENSFVTDFVERFSDYNKLIRTTAYWLRLIAKLNHGNTCKEGFLTTGELQQAEALLIRKVQDEYFSKEIKALHEGCAKLPSHFRVGEDVDEQGIGPKADAATRDCCRTRRDNQWSLGRSLISWNELTDQDDHSHEDADEMLQRDREQLVVHYHCSRSVTGGRTSSPLPIIEFQLVRPQLKL
nr:uncharacterized protein LOC115257813 [Aedes albopictus]